MLCDVAPSSLDACQYIFLDIRLACLVSELAALPLRQPGWQLVVKGCKAAPFAPKRRESIIGSLIDGTGGRLTGFQNK